MAKQSAASPRRVAYANHLVIMAKAPQLGRVKRRLGREIGDVEAVRFYRSCLSHTVLRLARDRRWRTLLAIDPDRDVGACFSLSRKLAARLTQGKGDLGQRMQRLFRRLPPGPAVIVGTDIPAMRAGDIAQAFAKLGGADAVFGRAPDGGYWLVGLKRVPKLLAPFAGVRWSSSRALVDTLKHLKGKRIGFVTTLSDVDIKRNWQLERVGAERLIVAVGATRARLIQL
ncbi:MAG TPA: TIGR04282 family arsenosugar biosynthesis glycosyltransferase [Methyloceanibacter sp.]|nr:TIGR04282 family arsenosugar biosynthesis glycosyltransferase [Methyloceanibacter sp.]